jgi:hypothetical protein
MTYTKTKQKLQSYVRKQAHEKQCSLPLKLHAVHNNGVCLGCDATWTRS